MTTNQTKDAVVAELQKTIDWLVAQDADSKLIAAVVHAMQLTCERFKEDETAEQFWTALQKDLKDKPPK